MFFLGQFLGHWFGWGRIESVFLGAIIAISSTTIIAKTLEGLGLIRQDFARLIFGVLIVEDVLAIAIMGILTSLGTTGHAGWYVTLGTLVKLIAFFESTCCGKTGQGIDTPDSGCRHRKVSKGDLEHSSHGESAP